MLNNIAENGIALQGCGNMGWALLQGWLAAGLPKEKIWIQDPNPSEALQKLARSGVRLNAELPDRLSILVIAVKPQIIDQVLDDVTVKAELVISIAAGVTMARFEAHFGAGQPVIRVMPNTPASIGRGMSVLAANAVTTPEHTDMALALMQAVGEAALLETEDQIDTATGLSGSGPGYVFYMIEALAAAGIAEGLPANLSMQLARATVAGAGEMAGKSSLDAAELRQNVTSPGGTTQAGLGVLMDADNGLEPLMVKTVRAAARRSRELRN